MNFPALILQSFHRNGSAENGRTAVRFLVNAEDRVLVSTLVRVIPAPKEARSPRLGQFSLERRLVRGDVIESHLQSGACLGNRNNPVLTFPETQGGNSP